MPFSPLTPPPFLLRRAAAGRYAGRQQKIMDWFSFFLPFSFSARLAAKLGGTRISTKIERLLIVRTRKGR